MGIKAYLESHDVSHADVAPFLLIHTVLVSCFTCAVNVLLFLGTVSGLIRCVTVLFTHSVSSTYIIYIYQSAALVGSTWWWCYWGSGRCLSNPNPPQFLKNNQQMPRSMLLNTLVAMPIISDGIKLRASRAMVNVYLTIFNRTY